MFAYNPEQAPLMEGYFRKVTGQMLAFKSRTEAIEDLGRRGWSPALWDSDIWVDGGGELQGRLLSDRQAWEYMIEDAVPLRIINQGCTYIVRGVQPDGSHFRQVFRDMWEFDEGRRELSVRALVRDFPGETVAIQLKVTGTKLTYTPQGYRVRGRVRYWEGWEGVGWGDWFKADLFLEHA